jgi:hypothetical protein
MPLRVDSEAVHAPPCAIAARAMALLASLLAHINQSSAAAIYSFLCAGLAAPRLPPHIRLA